MMTSLTLATALVTAALITVGAAAWTTPFPPEPCTKRAGLGSIQLPDAVLANGKPLTAGTYQVSLRASSPRRPLVSHRAGPAGSSSCERVRPWVERWRRSFQVARSTKWPRGPSQNPMIRASMCSKEATTSEPGSSVETCTTSSTCRGLGEAPVSDSRRRDDVRCSQPRIRFDGSAQTARNRQQGWQGGPSKGYGSRVDERAGPGSGQERRKERQPREEARAIRRDSVDQQP
jgi:hypothetical protein